MYLLPGSRSFDQPAGRTLREYGITLGLIPRIGRKRAESLYYLHLSLLWERYTDEDPWVSVGMFEEMATKL